MKSLKEGTAIKLTKDYLEWSANHTDTMHGYPSMIRPYPSPLIKLMGYEESVQEQLSDYFMKRYSFERNLDIDGVIIGTNGYKGDDFAYLVWMGNELGEAVSYISPQNLTVVKNG